MRAIASKVDFVDFRRDSAMSKSVAFAIALAASSVLLSLIVICSTQRSLRSERAFLLRQASELERKVESGECRVKG